MRLTEHQGKQLLARHGVPIPDGRLLLPGHDQQLRFPLVAKVQTLDGGRGKRGGIRVVHDRNTLRQVTDEWAAGTATLPPVSEVYAEELLDIRRELYLSIRIDRDLVAPILLVNPSGGVDVESLDPTTFRQQTLSRSTGPTPEQITKVVQWLGLDPTGAADCTAMISGLWDTFCQQDCLLVEINPVAVVADGHLVAADARIVVDDSARFRHPDWPHNADGTAFERAVEAAGAVGAEFGGTVAVVTSGAGLGMATVDLLTDAQIRPACWIDLGGVVFRGAQALAEVLRTVVPTAPKALFVNVFLQVGRCDEVAAAYLAVADELVGVDVVMRLRGRNAAQAAEILAGTDVVLTPDLSEALDALAAFTSKGEVAVG